MTSAHGRVPENRDRLDSPQAAISPGTGNTGDTASSDSTGSVTGNSGTAEHPSGDSDDHPSWCDPASCTVNGSIGVHKSAARTVTVGGVRDTPSALRIRQWQAPADGVIEVSPVFTEVSTKSADQWTELFDLDPEQLDVLQEILGTLPAQTVSGYQLGWAHGVVDGLHAFDGDSDD